jgi:hypothetical protein
MNEIRNSVVIIISTILIIYFRWLSVFEAGILYRKLLAIPFVKDNFENNIVFRIIFEESFYLLFILIFYFLFKRISMQFELNKMYLLIVVISPFLFDVSSILYDKSCLKPWYTFETFIWYFPIRLSLWIFLFLFFNDLIKMLKSSYKLLMVLIVFILFHSLKLLNKNYL